MRKLGIAVMISSALLMLPVVLIIAGCASTSVNESTYEVTQDADGNYQISENFYVNNPKLARGVRVTDQSSKFAGDLLMVQATLTSLYNDTQEYKYKFAWYDADGFEIDAGSNHWSPLIMYGSQTKTIKGVAPNPSARAFKLILRTD